MAKDKRAREMGYLSVAAIGVVIGVIVDTMRAADVPNDAVCAFIDRLEHGFASVLWGDALVTMFEMIDIIRAKLPSND